MDGHKVTLESVGSPWGQNLGAELEFTAELAPPGGLQLLPWMRMDQNKTVMTTANPHLGLLCPRLQAHAALPCYVLPPV